LSGYEPLFPLCEPARDRCFLDLSPIIVPFACSRSPKRALIHSHCTLLWPLHPPTVCRPLAPSLPSLFLACLPLSSAPLPLSPSLHDSPLCHSPPIPLHCAQRVAAPSFPRGGRRCSALQPIVSAGDSSTVTITGKVLLEAGVLVGMRSHGSLCSLFAVLPLRQHLPRLRQRKGCELVQPVGPFR